MAKKIQLRRDTAANWTSSNPTLAQGEKGIETDTGREKTGDGATAWTSLKYNDEVGITAVALVDGANVAITKQKHTLSTAQAAITFTDTFTGDFSNIEVTLSGITGAVWTFPAGSLCAYNGTASGDNTLTIADATAGDKILLARWNSGSAKYYVAINIGQ